MVLPPTSLSYLSFVLACHRHGTQFLWQVHQDQTRQVQSMLQHYRMQVLGRWLPSPERNHLLRVLQEVQSRLVVGLDQQAEMVQIVLRPEERLALRRALTDLLPQYGHEPASPERTRLLATLAVLKASIDRCD